jgi:hypothetical protein
VEQISNKVEMVVASDVNASQTSILVEDASQAPETGNFRLKSGNELMLCTDRTGNVLTVERGIEDTTATSHAAGEKITLVLTAGSLLQAIEDNAGGGAVSSVAGRTGDVTLSTSDISGLGSAATHAASDFDAAGSASAVNTALSAHTGNTSNPHSVTKAQVGLSNVSNALQLAVASNLGDLASVTVSRNNLGFDTNHLEPADYFVDSDNGDNSNAGTMVARLRPPHTP